jgi:hypothetical protein
MEYIILIFAQFVFIGIREYLYLIEREKLIKAILSKNLTDYTTSVIMEKEADKRDNKGEDKEPVLVDQLNDEQFQSLIKKTLDKNATK